MPFLKFFRDFFGGKTPEEPKIDEFYGHQYDRDSFRNPIWENDDDDNVDDFRHPRGGMHFQIFSDPLEMARFFESQMDSIIKSFGFGFGNGSAFMLPGQDHSMNALPFEPPSSNNLRDQVLKPDHDSMKQFIHPQPKEDADLDGKITTDEFSKVWNNQHGRNELQPVKPFQSRMGRFVTKQIIRGSNGTIEQKESLRDIEGNEETKIIRQIGDKMYTVTKTKDKNGIETQTEDLVNIDESELLNFTDKWQPLVKDETNFGNQDGSFSLGKFFWPRSKIFLDMN